MTYRLARPHHRRRRAPLPRRRTRSASLDSASRSLRLRNYLVSASAWDKAREEALLRANATSGSTPRSRPTSKPRRSRLEAMFDSPLRRRCRRPASRSAPRPSHREERMATMAADQPRRSRQPGARLRDGATTRPSSCSARTSASNGGVFRATAGLLDNVRRRARARHAAGRNHDRRRHASAWPRKA